MMILRAFTFLFFFSLPFSGVVFGGAFFSVLEDIPVMPGMEEIQERTIIFDKPDGRIVQVYALPGNNSKDQISSFYHETLPQFGWRKSGAKNTFLRRTEKLSITYESSGFVLFSVQPI